MKRATYTQPTVDVFGILMPRVSIVDACGGWQCSGRSRRHQS